MKNDKPARRIVLLGASNLTMAFPRLWGELRRTYSGPIDVFAALGHGRSYGQWSRVLSRELPGILESQLWADLRDRPGEPLSTQVLLTDVGNDLIYGVPIPQIVDWVSECLYRLSGPGTEMVLTLLPLHSLDRLSAVRFHLTRMLFFPGLRTPWSELRAQAHELDQQLRTLSDRLPVNIMEPRSEWYGFDPIHIRHTRRRAAWNEILEGWPSFRDQAALLRPQTPPPRLPRLRPAERRMFGKQELTPQPVAEFADGSRVSVY